MFVTNTQAAITGASELLTLTYTDGASAGAAGDLNFLLMVANAQTLFEFDETGLQIGTGTPTTALDGGDLYVTDDVEIDGTLTVASLDLGGSASPLWTWNDSDAAGGSTDYEAAQIAANLSDIGDDDEIGDLWLTVMMDDGIDNDNAAPQTVMYFDGSAYTMSVGVMTDNAATEKAAYESLTFDFDTAVDGEIEITSPSSSTLLDIQIATVEVDALTASGAITGGNGDIITNSTVDDEWELTTDDKEGIIFDLDTGTANEVAIKSGTGKGVVEPEKA
jgi:hypothetical protein